MSKFCPKCGCENLDEAAFCSNCGVSLPSIEEVKERAPHDESNQEYVSSNENEGNGTVQISKEDESTVKGVNSTINQDKQAVEAEIVENDVNQRAPIKKGSDAVTVDAEIDNGSGNLMKGDNDTAIICCLVLVVLFIIYLIAHF